MARGRMPETDGALLPVADVDLPYVLRVKNGDTEAFGTLWEKYERVLREYFVRETHNRHEAEDLVSETLIAALQAIPRFRGVSLEPGSSAPNRSCTFQTI